MELNLYFLVILVTVVAVYKLDLLADLLNLRALGQPLPDEFREVFDPEEFERSREYAKERTRLGVLEATVSLGVFLVFWFAGGFSWLDHCTRGVASGEIVRGWMRISFLVLATGMLSLPFEVYHTFVLEARYGFNRTTPRTFVLDRIKGLVLGAGVGLPVLALVIWFFETSPWAWLQAFLAVTTVSLLGAFLAPRWILPWFNKFTPLEEGELSRGIEDLSRRCDFPLGGISVMDGSQRSTKANAYFTGFGKNKRIALFDTLVNDHPVPELLAILAHEIGHYRKRHLVQGLAAGIAESALMFGLLGLFLRSEGLHAAFGIAEPSVSMGLILFGMLYTPLGKLTSVGRGMLSRRNEYEADAYAAEVTGRPEDLVAALQRLTKANLGNVTPHPFHVFLNHSHPPVVSRIRALRSGAAENC